MGFFKKEIVERKKSVKAEGEKKTRKATDFTLIHSEQNGIIRDTFTVSQKMFDEMGLATKCAAIWNNPNAFVVLGESSMLVEAGVLTAYRGSTRAVKEGKEAPTKSRNFGSPELVKDMVADGTIPAVRELRFKANFELVKVEDISAYVAEANAEIEGSGEEIDAVYVIQHIENTTFEERVKKDKVADAVAEPVSEQPITSGETTVESTTNTDGSVVTPDSELATDMFNDDETGTPAETVDPFSNF